MRERELDVNILTLVQINAFVTAAEKGVLDDAMVAAVSYTHLRAHET